ncbi:MAG: hypothetical protein OXE53_00955 [Deltaproteobacteria bacterium]|nr:hypothetical protein [Deltaproteobacteria bacterium]
MKIRVAEKNDYVLPGGVELPKGWELGQVLYDGKADGWSAAEGKYKRKSKLAIRWNGNLSRLKDRHGVLVERRGAAWFIVPDELENEIRRVLDSMKKSRQREGTDQ